jgi:hypothetical protein
VLLTLTKKKKKKKRKHFLHDPEINGFLLANLRTFDCVDGMDWATRKPCANWLLHLLFLFCVCQVGLWLPESVWLHVAPCLLSLSGKPHSVLPELQSFQGNDDKLFSARCAKSFLGWGIKEDHCCRWPLSLVPTPLGRGASPSLGYGNRVLLARGANTLINKGLGGNSNQSWKQKKKHFEVYWMPRCLSFIAQPGFIWLHSLPIKAMGKLTVYQMWFGCNVYTWLT